MIATPSHPRGQTAPIPLRDAIGDLPNDGPAIGGKHGEAVSWMPMGRINGDLFAPYAFALRRAHWDRVCFTIIKTRSMAHPDGARYLSIDAVKRIGSFPRQFVLTGSHTAKWARIGNSVPPLLARAIGRHVRGLPPLPLLDGTYVDRLEAAWAEHERPRASDAPTVISTFAGCGGSSLGYSMAGYREVLAVEWDAHAQAMFRANFHGVPVVGDIRALDANEAMSIAGVQHGELDVLDGSPPCQGFSTIGKKDMMDPRNQLFREFVRLLRALMPRVFVMENVSGMVKGDMRLVFAECMRELKSSGYDVKARLLNAMFFGVPQSRERMIIIGTRL